MAGEWGPLAGLIGEWESDKGGLDAAFSHSKGEVLQTPSLERVAVGVRERLGELVDLQHAQGRLSAR